MRIYQDNKPSSTVVTKILCCVISKDIERFAISVKDGLVGESFSKRKIVNCNHLENADKHFKSMDSAMKFQSRNTICVPVISDKTNRVLGVLQAVNKTVTIGAE
jgi:putative methionine-R-sulfoxide reductase with GAF domain